MTYVIIFVARLNDYDICDFWGTSTTRKVLFWYWPLHPSIPLTSHHTTTSALVLMHLSPLHTPLLLSLHLLHHDCSHYQQLLCIDVTGHIEIVSKQPPWLSSRVLQRVHFSTKKISWTCHVGFWPIRNHSSQRNLPKVNSRGSDFSVKFFWTPKVKIIGAGKCSI